MWRASSATHTMNRYREGHTHGVIKSRLWFVFVCKFGFMCDLSYIVIVFFSDNFIAIAIDIDFAITITHIELVQYNKWNIVYMRQSTKTNYVQISPMVMKTV